MKDALKNAMMNRRKGGISITIGPAEGEEMEGMEKMQGMDDGMAPESESMEEHELKGPEGEGSLLSEREMERAEMLAESGEEPKSLQDKILLEKFKKMNKEG